MKQKLISGTQAIDINMATFAAYIKHFAKAGRLIIEATALKKRQLKRKQSVYKKSCCYVHKKNSNLKPYKIPTVCGRDL